MEQPITNKTTVKIVEEIFNSITHGLGAVAGIVGLVLGLLTLAMPASFRVGFIIYCVSLILLMLISALYHALTFTKAKKVFRALDHGSIFLLIAGSFTPFIISLYSGLAQTLLLILVWFFAILGITISTIFVLPRNMKKTGALLYVGFGWLGVLLIPKLGALNNTVLWLVVAGGLLYTIGLLPYALKKPFTHFSWHIFVVAAACVQFFAVIKLVY